VTARPGPRPSWPRARILLLVGMLLLAGCTSAPPRDKPVAPFNATDVMFLQMMLTYQGQALKIVPLGAKRATREDVRTLAAAVEVTQADEAITMAGWLTSWKQPLVADPDQSLHADHGGLRDTSADELAALEGMTGADFDRRFLNLLIGHQHNSIEVARMETAKGVNPEARDLARRVDASRTAQIQQMLGMLSQSS
jgi:uncharacterized protein (DUF305 family)